jgi:hypothetical protein
MMSDYDAIIGILIACWNAIPIDNIKRAWNVVNTSGKHGLQQTLCRMIFARHSGLIFLFKKQE